MTRTEFIDKRGKKEWFSLRGAHFENRKERSRPKKSSNFFYYFAWTLEDAINFIECCKRSYSVNERVYGLSKIVGSSEKGQAEV